MVGDSHAGGEMCARVFVFDACFHVHVITFGRKFAYREDNTVQIRYLEERPLQEMPAVVTTVTPLVGKIISIVTFRSRHSLEL